MSKVQTNVCCAFYKSFDSRLSNPRYVNYSFAPPQAKSRKEWRQQATEIRRRALISAGLWPEPERTTLNARVYDRCEMDGYSLEKVHFESSPGLLVTGNLFRPLKSKEKCPAVLCPHGHMKHGRLEHNETTSTPAQGVMLARLGFVVFTYDMIGYNDSCQIEHRWQPDMVRRGHLYGVGTFGLQLWNSIRAVDFLISLPDVDSKRIGCTGASGGATQTYYLALADKRVCVTVPVCMMSSHMQGGCTCEQAPFLHFDGISTLDVVGALVPRPVLLPSVTQDWTNQNPTHDIPAVRRLYMLFGVADGVINVHLDAPHGYNKDIREHMYAWFRRWLANDKKAGKRIRETVRTIPTEEQARLFPDGNPPARLKRDKEFFEGLIDEAREPFAEPPKFAAALRARRSRWLELYKDVFHAAEPDEDIDVGTHVVLAETPEFTVIGRAIGRYGRGEQMPANWIVPKKAGKRSPAALVVTENGKDELFAEEGPGPLLAGLLKGGVRVLAIDMLGKGETAPLLAAERLDRKDPNFYAFNRSLTSHRVQDILTALASMRQYDHVEKPALIGVGLGGVMALLARPLAGPLRSTIVDLKNCKTSSDEFWLGEAYHPFIRKLGDVRGAVALGPTSPLAIIAVDPDLRRWAEATYRLRRKLSSLRIFSSLVANERFVAKLARVAVLSPRPWKPNPKRKGEKK